MKLRNINANTLAKKFNKDNGVMLYSGTIAIESALICAKIKHNDKVLISNSVCYSIFEAIQRVGAIPIIVVPSNGLILSSEEIKYAIKQEKDIKCIIAVHQYGLIQSVKSIRKIAKNIKIIEDVSQAWNIIEDGYSAGKYSDFVVTSFGKTKPLSLGYGGAIFSNIILEEFFDYYDNDSRNKITNLLPYTFNLCEKINVKKLISLGDKNINKQRIIANLFKLGFSNCKYISFIKNQKKDYFTWHRFPIIINNQENFEKTIKLLENYKIKYQLPHNIELFNLKMVKNSNSIIIKKFYKKNNIILLRTRTNKIKYIKKFLKKIILEETK
ncbi:MAG: DegT/DnrJ/EryC1/StrS family aminotransferase [Bacilli bacterium]|nr:DegT/DnrJ/EryC1/StrS family aminotransferase [Bacilli bacterium]